MAQALFVIAIPILWLISIIHAVLVTRQKNNNLVNKEVYDG